MIKVTYRHEVTMGFKILRSWAGNTGKTPFTPPRRFGKKDNEKNRSSSVDGIITDWKEAGKMKRVLIVDNDPSIL